MESLKVEFLSYSVVSLILSAIKRNGLEKTLQDLRSNCRIEIKDNEVVYQDFLQLLNNISKIHKEEKC